MRFPIPGKELALPVVLLTFCAWNCAAQQAATAPGADESTQPAASTTAAQPGSGNGNSQRLFGVLPNFLTVENAANVQPLTAGQKFKETARGAFDYAEFAWYGALAGISQAENANESYGQGAEGYAKRYGSAFADGTIENFATKAVLPSILHQDPRYFQLGKGGIRHRALYAASRVFVTRGDSGNTQFNFSEILGSAGAAGISAYSYHPAEDGHWSSVLTIWGEQVGYDAISFLAKEFWPDIHRKLHKEK